MRVARLGLAVLGLLPAGCGGHGGGGTPAPTVLAPNVTVLPSDGSVVISDVTDSSVTLTGNVPPLAAGEIIMRLSRGGGCFARS